MKPILKDEQEAEEIEKFVEETFDKKNFDKLRELQEYNSISKIILVQLDENPTKKDAENKETTNEGKIFSNNL